MHNVSGRWGLRGAMRQLIGWSARSVSGDGTDYACLRASRVHMGTCLSVVAVCGVAILSGCSGSQEAPAAAQPVGTEAHRQQMTDASGNATCRKSPTLPTLGHPETPLREAGDSRMRSGPFVGPSAVLEIPRNPRDRQRLGAKFYLLVRVSGFRGLVLRGQNVEGQGPLLFKNPATGSKWRRTVRVRPGDLPPAAMRGLARGWAGLPGALRISGPGCFRIEGRLGARDWSVNFEARLAAR